MAVCKYSQRFARPEFKNILVGGGVPLRGYVRGVLSEAKSRAALRICEADSNAPTKRRFIRRYPLCGDTPQRPVARGRSCARLSVAADDEFARRQFLASHGAVSMEF